MKRFEFIFEWPQNGFKHFQLYLIIIIPDVDKTKSRHWTLDSTIFDPVIKSFVAESTLAKTLRNSSEKIYEIFPFILCCYSISFEKFICETYFIDNRFDLYLYSVRNICLHYQQTVHRPRKTEKIKIGNINLYVMRSRLYLWSKVPPSFIIERLDIEMSLDSREQ